MRVSGWKKIPGVSFVFSNTNRQMWEVVGLVDIGGIVDYFYSQKQGLVYYINPWQKKGNVFVLPDIWIY